MCSSSWSSSVYLTVILSNHFENPTFRNEWKGKITLLNWFEWKGSTFQTTFKSQFLIFFHNILACSKPLHSNVILLRSSNEDSGVDRTPEAVPDILKSWLQKLEESTKSSESFDLLTFKVNWTFKPIIDCVSNPKTLPLRPYNSLV